MRYAIRHFKTVSSTNDLAMNLGAQGEPEGIVVTADYQTHGRGRFRRKWVSPRGKNLLFSILLRPEVKATKAPLLTHLAAHSVKEVLEEKVSKREITLKRPNDVLIDGKKVAGILVEGRTERGIVHYAAVGIGLNVNAPMKDKIKGSTSIIEETGRKDDIQRILRLILDKFTSKYRVFIESKHYEARMII